MIDVELDRDIPSLPLQSGPQLLSLDYDRSASKLEDQMITPAQTLSVEDENEGQKDFVHSQRVSYFICLDIGIVLRPLLEQFPLTAQGKTISSFRSLQILSS